MKQRVIWEIRHTLLSGLKKEKDKIVVKSLELGYQLKQVRSSQAKTLCCSAPVPKHTRADSALLVVL